MKLRIGPLLITVAVVLAPLAWSQSGPPGSQDTSSDSSYGQSSKGPKQVFSHPEEKPPLALFDEATSNSFILLGMALGTSWDSNAALFAAHGYSRTFFTVGPKIELQQIHPHV